MTHIMYTLSRQHVQEEGYRSSVLAACRCVNVLCFCACVCLCGCYPGVKCSVGGGQWDQQMLNTAHFTVTRIEQRKRGKCVFASCCMTEKCSTFAQETHCWFTLCCVCRGEINRMKKADAWCKACLWIWMMKIENRFLCYIFDEFDIEIYKASIIIVL